MKYEKIDSLLMSTFQPERRLHLDKTLYEMAITSATIYALIGISGLLGVTMTTPPGMEKSLIAITSIAALITGILFYLFRNYFNLFIANIHMFLAVGLVTIALWAGQAPETAAISMIYILTTLYAFHFFTLPTNLFLITIIGCCFAGVANDLNWSGWQSVLVLLIGSCITGGIVINFLVKRIHKLATTDKLTGAYNRHTWDAMLENELNYARRHKRLLSLLIIDLDDFKAVNDIKGHQAGDKVLIDTAHKIQNYLRQSDTLARWGGDEFAILLRDCDYQDAQSMAERLKAHLEAITPFTAGIAQCEATDTTDSLVSRADNNLLKKQGSSPRTQSGRHSSFHFVGRSEGHFPPTTC